MQIALGTPAPQNRLRLPGVTMAAGDRLQRTFDLRAENSAPIMRVALTSRARPSSLLDRGRVHGLRLRIDRCSTAWQESKPPYRYSCPGRRTQVVPWRPVIGTNVWLVGLANLARTKSAHLLLALLLPQTAPNSLQGQRSGLTYTFTAAQAAKRR